MLITLRAERVKVVIHFHPKDFLVNGTGILRKKNSEFSQEESDL